MIIAFFGTLLVLTMTVAVTVIMFIDEVSSVKDATISGYIAWAKNEIRKDIAVVPVALLLGVISSVIISIIIMLLYFLIFNATLETLGVILGVGAFVSIAYGVNRVYGGEE